MKFVILPLILIANQINLIRSKFDLPDITYNFELHNKLIEFNKPGEWYYSKSNYSEYLETINRTKTLNKDFLLRDDYFKNFTDFKYMFSDTYAKGKSIAYIIKFRTAQLNCFNWYACNKTNYDYYFSCLKNGPELKNCMRCSFAYAYLPKYLEKSLKEIACINLRYKSPYTPTNQDYSFACYGKYIDKITNDYPFD